MLLMIGILTLYKFRGYSRGLKNNEDAKMTEEEKIKLKKTSETSMILGIFYMALSIGIAVNYLTRLLLLIFSPLQDKFIFSFINLVGMIPEE